MKSADKLIDSVAEIVQDPSFDRPRILTELNGGLSAVASALLLPDLADGNATVYTVVGDNKADVPQDFHKQLTMAQVADYPVRVFHSSSLLTQRYGILNTDAGIVKGIAVSGRSIYYQNVPEATTGIDIMYYRVPADMTDISTSYPDGVSNCLSFEEAIKHYACWKLYEIIEDGIEGAKVNTAYHKSMFDKYLLETDQYCRRTTGAQVELPLSGSAGDSMFID